MFLLYILPGLAMASALMFAWMALIEPRRFRVWQVSLPRLPERKDGEMGVQAGRLPELNILHITDTHFNGNDGLKLDFLTSVLQDNSDLDLVFLTGDILDAPKGLDSCMAMADMIESRLGAYAVLGGHDFYRSAELWQKYLSIHKTKPTPSQRRKPNPVNELRNGFCEKGVLVLEDDNRIIDLPGGERFAVVGLNDTFFFDCDHEKAWNGVNGMPAIVLAHSPDVLPQVKARGAEMAFFGHTHGGQVRLPFKGAVITRSTVGRHRARGVFRDGGTIFSINQGMGATSGTHIRLCCPPEVTLMRVAGEEFSQDYISMPCWVKSRVA